MAYPVPGQEPPRNHALLIGIDEYPTDAGVKRLYHAKKDAESLKNILAAKRYNVKALLEDVARKGAIVSALTNLAKTAGPDDSVLIYFAGHGVRQRNGNNEYIYWVAYDTTIARLDVEGIRLSHLLDYVNDIPATRKILILDHCYSGDVTLVRDALSRGDQRTGAAAELELIPNGFPKEAFDAEVNARKAEGLVILGAASQEAYEFKTLGHGIFTYVLIEALTTDKADNDKDGRLSVGELEKFLKDGVDDLAQKQNTPERTIRQRPIDIVKGTDLSSWKLIDVGSDTGSLKKAVSKLAVECRLDFSVESASYGALDAWERAKASGLQAAVRDQRIVERLMALRDAGLGMDCSRRKDMLEQFVRELLVSP